MRYVALFTAMSSETLLSDHVYLNIFLLFCGTEILLINNCAMY